MIAVHIKPQRTRGSRAPLVLALFSYRYDAHLVPDLLVNIDPLVDGWVSFDDRAASGLFSDEPHRRRALVMAARDAGADWILPVDPDERFESRLADAMRELVGVEGQVAYTFPVREMFLPDAYRVDGVWGRKQQSRLIRVPDEIGDAAMPLHSPWHTMAPGAELRAVDFNLYHLKMIAPERRRARRDLYNRLDPNRACQALGYDYLDDERGMVLEQIPEGRGYLPAFEDDNGLWMGE